MRVKQRLAEIERKIRQGKTYRGGAIALYDPQHPELPPERIDPADNDLPITILLPKKGSYDDQELDNDGGDSL